MFPSTDRRLRKDETNIQELHQEMVLLRNQNHKFKHVYFKLVKAQHTVSKLQHYIFTTLTKPLIQELSLRLESNYPSLYDNACVPYAYHAKRKAVKTMVNSHFFKDLPSYHDYIKTAQLAEKVLTGHMRKYTKRRIDNIYNLVPGYKKLHKPIHHN